ncbi:ribosome maturation factor RimM [Microcoleus sp. FACHB-1515]|uniref:ribosome maturation factor RimM n=1 Tax=Cyanophyceae TaxID=3028117 RepID=UPI0016860960|nr:ribosome maturation factor RimM [Microcoleus sp. FACHB-1515]MBD2090429.1 ribosome maturation factor RimM [Microcoleus sp. FACHB-1515]
MNRSIDPQIPAGWIAIGKIVSAQGLKGELRVYPDTDFPDRFIRPGDRWLLRPGQSDPESVELKSGRYLDGKGLYVIRLAGISDRNAAEALRNCLILVREDDRPPLEAGEFHVLDLIGLLVFQQESQEAIGTVTDVIPAGNDLLEVVLKDSNQRVLIPFVEAIVPIVDLENRRIEINPPAGLLDVNRK